MLTLELVTEQVDWKAALRVAMTRPPGLAERRAREEPWAPPSLARPRRISDDLSWLRAAIDEPQEHGLRRLDGTAAVAVWAADEERSGSSEHLLRLDERGVLEAAGFLLGGTPDDTDEQ